jgi:hypothetical protein
MASGLYVSFFIIFLLKLFTMNLDLNLDQVEFSALPSGLHLVEQDVVCVSKAKLIPNSLTSFLDTSPKMINKAFASSVAAKQLNTAIEGSDSVLLGSCSPNHADRVLGDMLRH